MLLNCLVFGKRAGAKAAEISRARSGRPSGSDAVYETIATRSKFDGGKPIKEAHRRIKQAMTDHALVVRNAAGLTEAGETLAEVGRDLASGAFSVGSRKDLIDLYEAMNLADVGRMMCVAAGLRKETRGSHYREDAPNIDPALAHPIMISLGADGAPDARFGSFGTTV
jgi:succinate dehydrogenase/fumarate reductase flavoprotein subunit